MEAGVNEQICTETVGGLTDRISHLIENRTHRSIRDLEVSLDETELTVSGSARTYYSKQLATQAAIEAVTTFLSKRVLAIDNRIEVI